MSRYEVGLPSFASVNKVSSKTVNPAIGDGKNPAKELPQWHLKQLQTPPNPKENRWKYVKLAFFAEYW